MQLQELLEVEDDINISTKPLRVRAKDARAQHCITAKELDLFKFSSDYQTYLGGTCDLQNETGLDVGSVAAGMSVMY